MRGTSTIGEDTGEEMTQEQVSMKDSFPLVREALVREIRDAKVWSSVEEAWQTLLRVCIFEK